MSGSEIVTTGRADVAMAYTAAEVRAQVARIHEIMKGVMQEGTHFGKIPGTPKPTLFLPGAEKIMFTFRMVADDPVTIDLSTPGIVHYRTIQRILDQNGNLVAAGTGECSSEEEKYKWRKPICSEEWEETPEDMRREVWKRYDSKPARYKQVRINPADVANTILKMSVKRALIAGVRLATAASDVFTQDLEEMPPEIRDVVAADEPLQKPGRKSEAEPAAPVAPPPAAAVSGAAPTLPDEPAGQASSAPDPIVIGKVTVRNGGTKEKPWRLYVAEVEGGKRVSTFDDVIGKRLEALQGQRAVILTEQDAKGYTNVVEIIG